MKKKHIIIPVLILLVAMAAVFCFAQAKNHPSDKEPTDSQLTVSNESKPNTETNDNTVVVESSDENSFMSITVPKYWKVKKEKNKSTHSIVITPKDSKGSATLTCYKKGGFGVCGTGLTTESILGGEGSVGFYDNNPSWDYIVIHKGDMEFVTTQISLSVEECDAVRAIIENGVYKADAVATDLDVTNIKYTRVAWSEEGENIFRKKAVKNDYTVLSSKRAVPTIAINSKDKLDSLIKETEDYFHLSQKTSGESFVSVAEKYGEDFFSDKILLITYVPESSGSITHSVESVSKDSDKLEIYIKTNEPQVGTADMAGWFISMEISKDDVKGVTVVNSWT